MERFFHASFRTPLDGVGFDKSRSSGDDTVLSGRCACGQVSYVARLREPTLTHCGCQSCRRYHAASFAASVATMPDAVNFQGETRVYRHSCARFGTVERIACSKCYGKLASRLMGPVPNAMHLAAGSIVDESVPLGTAFDWQRSTPPVETVWGSSLPSLDPYGQERPLPLEVTPEGGCVCGACRFEASGLLPGQLQHCYCVLCRQLSGSAFMTWMPCDLDEFQWTKSNSLRVIRTTAHGRRHICRECFSVMTIVYDSEPDVIWPAAGSLDDALLPNNFSSYNYRSIHICCEWMQPWHLLPDDGLPRLRFAG